MTKSLIRNNIRGNDPDVKREIGYASEDRPAILETLREELGAEEYNLFLRNTPRALWEKLARETVEFIKENDRLSDIADFRACELFNTGL